MKIKSSTLPKAKIGRKRRRGKWRKGGEGIGKEEMGEGREEKGEGRRKQENKIKASLEMIHGNENLDVCNHTLSWIRMYLKKCSLLLKPRSLKGKSTT